MVAIETLMNKLNNYLKLSLLFILTGVIFFSCSTKVQVTNSEQALVDSLTISEFAGSIRISKKSNTTQFEILKDSILFAYNLGNITTLKNPFGAKAHNFLQLSNNHYYNTEANNHSIIEIDKDKLITHPLFSNVYSLNGKQYISINYSYNTFILLDSNRFISIAFPKLDNPIKTLDQYKKNQSECKLGVYKIENNGIVLEKLIPFFEPGMLLNTTKLSRVNWLMCQSNNQIFIAPNFLDTIWVFDRYGNSEGGIPLPDCLNFTYFNNQSINELNVAEWGLSDITGNKNMKVFYNLSDHTLLLITLDGLKQNFEYDVTPAFDDLDWYASVYSLDKKQWIKVIRFDKKYDIRNVLFEKGKILVKRRTTKPTFDIFSYE